MLKRTIFALVCLIWLATTNIFCQTISWEDMQKLDEGNVSLNKMLTNGKFIMVSEYPQDKSMKILLVSRRGRVRKRILVPAKKVEYVSSDTQGKFIVIYTPVKWSFFLYNTKNKQWKLILGRRGAHKGFALFQGKKSFMFFSGKNLYAWGFFYDRSGQYTHQGFVKIDYEKQGEEAIIPILDDITIEKMRKQYMPFPSTWKICDANNRYVIITFQSKRAVYGMNKLGCIVAYDMKKNKSFKIYDYTDFYGVNIHPHKNIVAFSCKPLGSTVYSNLIIFDLDKHIPIKRFSGRLFHPVWDEKGKRIAASLRTIILGKPIDTFMYVIDVHRNKIYKIPLKGIHPIDWCFYSWKKIHLFDGNNIYSIKY